jgi:hypothetical protein
LSTQVCYFPLFCIFYLFSRKINKWMSFFFFFCCLFNFRQRFLFGQGDNCISLFFFVWYHYIPIMKILLIYLTKRIITVRLLLNCMCRTYN